MSTLKKTIKDPSMTNHKQRASILERVEMTEGQLRSLAQNVSTLMGNVSSQVDNLAKLVNAIAGILGPDVVTARVRQDEIDTLEAQADAVAKNIEESLKKGELVSMDAVDSPEVFVVTRQFNKAGDVMHPSRIQLPFDGYVTEAQGLILGKKVGDTVELPDGGKLEILAVYRFVQVEAPAPASIEATATPAQ